MKIILGIGNPGPEYQHTRHNVGFDAVDLVAKQNDIEPASRARFSSLAASGMICGERAILLKPQTYVNLSGEAARAALDWHRQPPDALLVVCDDFNLELGRIRVRPQGSSGGHRGLQSIIDALGTEAYPRLRIGIGRPGTDEAVDFVLSRFQDDEVSQVQSAIRRASEAVLCWVTEGIEACMNKFNTT